ncbi:MAG: hypothetical protein WBP26_02520 [Candidatus Saccharimonadales bacterium]
MYDKNKLIDTLRATRNGFAVAAGFVGAWVVESSGNSNELLQSSLLCAMGAAALQAVIGPMQTALENDSC